MTTTLKIIPASKPDLSTALYAHNKLMRQQYLKSQIAALQAEFDEIKEELIDIWFSHTPKFLDENGIEICSYEASIRVQFKQKEFEKANPELFDKFCELKEIKTYRLSK